MQRQVATNAEEASDAPGTMGKPFPTSADLLAARLLLDVRVPLQLA
jgi:hypothetical protein